MRFELAPKRMQAVCQLHELLLVNYSYPYNWAGHREGSVTKSRSCPWNSVIAII